MPPKQNKPALDWERANDAVRFVKDPELKAIARDMVLRHLESMRAMKPAKKGRAK